MNTIKTTVKPLKFRFDLESTTSDGGLLVLEKLDRRMGLTKRMASCILDSRRRDVSHSCEKLLRQRVYGMCLGWEDCNDFDTLSSDPFYSLALGSKPASQPTLSRFENQVDRKDLYRLSLELVKVFIDSHKMSPPRQIVIDMDATDDPTHGQQQLEFYHGYYRKHCFLPLLVFCSVDGQCEELVAAVLRPGNVHAGKRSATILRRLVVALRKAFPSTKIVFRADGGFALPEVYETCEELKISYLISFPKNSRLLNLAAPYMKKAIAMRDATGLKARHFGAVLYAADSWGHSRRVIVKAEAMEKGENPRFVVTNLKGDPPRSLRRVLQARRL